MEKRILLVEDNDQFRENFARTLERALAAEPLDVTFVEAGSLAEARVRLREGGLDAALIDVRLPDGMGWTSCASSTTVQLAASRRSS